jgi:hypothetical protein
VVSLRRGLVVLLVPVLAALAVAAVFAVHEASPGSATHISVPLADGAGGFIGCCHQPGSSVMQ